ncbi:MAG: Mrp/NBP35 family ATP-binding protein [Atopobiaceae bacterium]|jgi:Mrp family chromosome partitioning ATPase|nr:Mrp/NBP35 family ATP-binding protein [Atopobiaceae bacterium]MCH4120344.1 Mrp/NBP35 family ATP-binding protein [Atopobiaceae bacterium]MCI1318599.1 Mrp/NBP35 family ATP-binding protein [Atopobiaceae bacterium]MCI1389447.1 Mrp/NBP35 family ATP-binding protein [Atopobiaceae bacterium]MCI1432272.1 Mrp/NBP35 family ATP-binding protein [Atopobiaceae bacterium]
MAQLSDEEREVIRQEMSGGAQAGAGAEGAGEGQAAPEQGTGPDLFEMNPLSQVHHMVGVVSGKGGVGKSMVTGVIAVELARAGHTVAMLDADITGPSIPTMFGLGGSYLTALGDNIMPARTKGGIQVVSTNLMLTDEREPVIWRGPVLAGALKQFYSDTAWGDVDYLVCDMPPGTGDVPLTVMQSMPIEGVVCVTSPQELVQVVVGKSVRMAQMMQVPVLGIVENMSYVTCPDCGRKIYPFGDSHLEETARRYGLPVLGRMPMDPALAAAADAGRIEEDLPENMLPDVIAMIEDLPDLLEPAPED